MKSGDARVALIGFPSVGKVSEGLWPLCVQAVVCSGCRADLGSQNRGIVGVGRHLKAHLEGSHLEGKLERDSLAGTEVAGKGRMGSY